MFDTEVNKPVMERRRGLNVVPMARQFGLFYAHQKQLKK